MWPWTGLQPFLDGNYSQLGSAPCSTDTSCFQFNCTGAGELGTAGQPQLATGVLSPAHGQLNLQQPRAWGRLEGSGARITLFLTPLEGGFI